MLKDGWKSIGRVFILALVLDAIYQVRVLHYFYLGEAPYRRRRSRPRALPHSARNRHSPRAEEIGADEGAGRCSAGSVGALNQAPPRNAVSTKVFRDRLMLKCFAMRRGRTFRTATCRRCTGRCSLHSSLVYQARGESVLRANASTLLRPTFLADSATIQSERNRSWQQETKYPDSLGRTISASGTSAISAAA